MPNDDFNKRALEVLAGQDRKLDEIVSVLKGDSFGNPGLVHRVASVEKKILNADKRYAALIAGGGVILFVIEHAWQAYFGK